MNDNELQSFEAELRALKPAAPPRELLARLEAARPTRMLEHGPEAVRTRRWEWLDILRWLAPAAAAAGLLVALAVWQVSGGKRAQRQAVTALPPASAAPDQVEIDRELVASYDAIAALASGEPVRFHCREWREKVLFRDPARGIAIERRAPRLEVIPVSLETY